MTTPSWDEAIQDAEVRLKRLDRQRVGLQMALRTFKAQRRDGRPWPGEETKDDKRVSRGDTREISDRFQSSAKTAQGDE